MCDVSERRQLVYSHLQLGELGRYGVQYTRLHGTLLKQRNMPVGRPQSAGTGLEIDASSKHVSHAIARPIRSEREKILNICNFENMRAPPAPH